MSESTDHAITAVTEDGAFRVIALRTTDTTTECLRTQSIERAVDDRSASDLADVVTGTILVRLTMAPSLRVQGIVRGAGGRGTLVGDSHPDGATRCLMHRPGGLERVSLAEGALMQMMRTMPTGAVQQGVVEVPDESVSAAVMSYLSSSEQITSVAMVASEVVDGEVRGAGGYIVQLLPEVSRAPLAVMTERLDADFSDAAVVLGHLAKDPAELVSEILYRMPYAQTQHAELRFGCRCSSVRVLSSLSTLSREDIRELMDTSDPLHITCDYCGQVYELSPKALEGLLEQS